MIKIGRQRFEEFVFRVGRDKLYAAYNHGSGTVYVGVGLLTARTIKGSVGIGTRAYIPVEEMRKLHPAASEKLDHLEDTIKDMVGGEAGKGGAVHG